MIKLPGLPASNFTATTVALDASGVRTFTGSPVANLVLGAGSIAPWVHVILFIAAGKATSTLSVPAAWNVFAASEGYVFDPDLDTIIEIQTMEIGGATKVFGSLHQVTPPDVAAPTVESATAENDELTVEFSEAVTATGVGGLSLSYTTGTARTITGVVSGNGTDTIVYQLSGAVDDGDVADFIVASSGVQTADAAGNPVAASTTAVSFVAGSAMPTGNFILHYSASRQLAEGISIGTRVTDFSGSGNHGVQQGGVVLSGGQFDFSAAASCGLLAPSGTNWPVNSSYTLCVRLRRTSGTWLGSQYQVVFGNTSSLIDAVHYWDGSQDDFLVSHGPTSNRGQLGMPSWVADDDHLMIIDYDFAATTLRVYIDDVVTPASTVTSYPAQDLTGLRFAAGVYGSSLSWRHKMGGIAMYSRLLSEAERVTVAGAL